MNRRTFEQKPKWATEVKTRKLVAPLARSSEGVVDVAKLRPMARLGYSQEYTVVREALDLR